MFRWTVEFKSKEFTIDNNSTSLVAYPEKNDNLFKKKMNAKSVIFYNTKLLWHCYIFKYTKYVDVFQKWNMPRTAQNRTFDLTEKF